MNDFEIEITYSVQYQEVGNPDWYVFNERGFYANAVGRMYDETHDFNEAFKVATGLKDGSVQTDPRPKYQKRVQATQITQRIYGGGTLMTFGQPIKEPSQEAAPAVSTT